MHAETLFGPTRVCVWGGRERGEFGKRNDAMVSLAVPFVTFLPRGRSARHAGGARPHTIYVSLPAFQTYSEILEDCSHPAPPRVLELSVDTRELKQRSDSSFYSFS